MIYRALFHVSSRLALGLSLRLLLDSADEGAGGQNPPPQPPRRGKRPPQNRAKRGPQGRPRKHIQGTGGGTGASQLANQGPNQGLNQGSNQGPNQGSNQGTRPNSGPTPDQTSGQSQGQGESLRQPRRLPKGKRPGARERKRQDPRKQEGAFQTQDESVKWAKRDKRSKGPLPGRKESRRENAREGARESFREGAREISRESAREMPRESAREGAKEDRSDINRPAAAPSRPAPAAFRPLPSTTEALRPAPPKKEEGKRPRKSDKLQNLDELMASLQNEQLAEDPACPPSHFWNRSEVLSRYRSQKLNEILQNEQKQADQELEALRQGSDNLETEIWAAVTSLTHLDVE